jgi:hypothetical protein
MLFQTFVSYGAIALQTHDDRSVDGPCAQALSAGRVGIGAESEVRWRRCRADQPPHSDQLFDTNVRAISDPTILPGNRGLKLAFGVDDF